MEETLKSNDDIAAVMLEASGANWGSVPLPANFLQEIRDLTDKYGVVLIFDEVITGFRWSPGGVQGLTGIVPDMTCMAKIVTGGNPGGALGGKADIMEVLNPRTTTHAGRKVVHKGNVQRAPPRRRAGRRHAQDRQDGRAAQARRCHRREDTRGYPHHPRGAPGSGRGIRRVVDLPHSFRQYAVPGFRRGTDAEEIRGIPSSTVLAYQQALLERGINNMSHLGGITSSAHTDEDVEITLRAIEGTIEQLMSDGVIGRG